MDCFYINSVKLIRDKYDGVTIDHLSIPKEVEEFENTILDIINTLENKKLLWIKLPIEHSHLVPTLTKHKFIFHHCNENELMLLKRLIENPIIPTATNHTLGVGAIVINDNKLLVIKDRFQAGYKLPGGHIDDNENISQALSREVYEETGIEIELDTVISLGHFSPAQFGESNLYVLCTAKPLSFEINIQDSHEILEAKWLEVDKFFEYEDIHPYNKEIVRAALKNEGLKIEDKNLPFQKKSLQFEFFF